MMKKLILAFLLAQMSSVFAAATTIVCSMEGLQEPISFEVPKKVGDLPSIDLSYPSDASVFSFRDGNLLLIAMDHDDKSRLRLLISAQASKKGLVYKGQFVMDSGGNQLQLDNGAVSCK